MSLILRRKLRHRHGRAVAVALITALALSVGMAHSAMGSHHMGEAVVICLAIGVATVAVAASPRLGRPVPAPVRPRQRIEPSVRPAASVAVPQGRARGHPSILQVFRR